MDNISTSQQEAVTSQKNLLADILAEYKNVKAEFKAKTAEKKELIAEQKNCGIHFIRASKLGEQIACLERLTACLNSRVGICFRPVLLALSPRSKAGYFSTM